MCTSWRTNKTHWPNRCSVEFVRESALGGIWRLQTVFYWDRKGGGESPQACVCVVEVARTHKWGGGRLCVLHEQINEVNQNPSSSKTKDWIWVNAELKCGHLAGCPAVTLQLIQLHLPTRTALWISRACLAVVWTHTVLRPACCEQYVMDLLTTWRWFLWVWSTEKKGIFL